MNKCIKLLFSSIMAICMLPCSLTALNLSLNINRGTTAKEAGIVKAEDPVQYTVTYDANGGTFDGGGTTNAVTYNVISKYEKYVHTDNIDDAGVANGTYTKLLLQTKSVSFAGATNLHVDVWYSTENARYDWLAIYSGTATTPSATNYSSSVSGKLGGGAKNTYAEATTASFDLSGTDTVQFYFKSDSSGNYYGYFAVVTATDAAGNYINATGSTAKQVTTITSGTFIKPKKDGMTLKGWTSDASGNNIVALNENNFPMDRSIVLLYAKWQVKSLNLLNTCISSKSL